MPSELIYSLLQALSEGKARYDYMEAFEDFRKQETALWKKLQGRGRPASELVLPSGDLDSPIAHHLHCPSFTTIYRYNGVTADRSNPCIALVIAIRRHVLHTVDCT